MKCYINHTITVQVVSAVLNCLLNPVALVTYMICHFLSIFNDGILHLELLRCLTW